MTAKALLKQAELQRLAKVAKRHGITIEVETEHYKLRMYPTEPAAEAADQVVTPSDRNPWDIPYHEMPPSPIQPRFDHREERTRRHMQQKLAGRGYIGVSAETDRQGNPTEIWLTKAGQKAMRDLDMHRSKYPVL
ncbi:hypothetical protein [Ensifer aridi]|uniref:hypothetical protein n=1 Tax=Ensifer aridi TaxID=1708715 RepID=UPI00047AA0E8|nr:hypothetical protein [Ensifer aridi]